MPLPRTGPDAQCGDVMPFCASGAMLAVDGKPRLCSSASDSVMPVQLLAAGRRLLLDVDVDDRRLLRLDVDLRRSLPLDDRGLVASYLCLPAGDALLLRLFPMAPYWKMRESLVDHARPSNGPENVKIADLKIPLQNQSVDHKIP